MTLTLAALDPGSARCALVIARHEASAPLTLLHARLYPVGHLAPRATPKIVTRKDGSTQVYDLERVSSPEEDSRLVSAIMLDVIRHGVTDLLIERTDPYLAENANIGAQRAQVKAVSIADRLATRIADRCEVLGIRLATTTDRKGHVHLGVPRVSWLAALRRYAAATGLPIPKAIGDGTALDPLLRQHLPELFATTGAALLDATPTGQAQSDAPGDDSAHHPAPEEESSKGVESSPAKPRLPTPDLRDAAGLLLSRVLPIPAATRSPRSPASPGASPRARAPRLSSLPGSPSDSLDPAATSSDAGPSEAFRRAKDAARVSAKIAARRQVLGCTCPAVQRGRHPATCPAAAKAAARSAARLEQHLLHARTHYRGIRGE